MTSIVLSHVRQFLYLSILKNVVVVFVECEDCVCRVYIRSKHKL